MLSGWGCPSGRPICVRCNFTKIDDQQYRNSKDSRAYSCHEDATDAGQPEREPPAVPASYSDGIGADDDRLTAALPLQPEPSDGEANHPSRIATPPPAP